MLLRREEVAKVPVGESHDPSAIGSVAPSENIYIFVFRAVSKKNIQS